MKKKLSNQKLYSNIQLIIEASKDTISRSINITMVKVYWEIGRLIFEEEQKGKKRADYGQYIINSVSKKLSKKYGKGFSSTNLKQMRQFYICFPIGQTLSDQLSWSHYLVLTKIDDKKVRLFYLKECVNAKWSVRELERQAASLLYERLALSKNKKRARALSKKGHELQNPSDLVKDPYILEFLGLKQEAGLYEKK